MTIVSEALGATIIHHTGTFIRFHKTDVAHLPSNERACDIELPDGRVVQGKFAANRDLLNINGRDLVRWIKSWLPETQSAKVTIHPVGTADKIRIELSGKSGFPSARARNGVMAKSPKVKGLTRDRKRVAFERWERDPGLRRAVLAAWGPKCQVKGYRAEVVTAGKTIANPLVDVHHLQSVSASGDDSPANRIVLCLMHHGLIHRAKNVSLKTNGTVQFVADGVKFAAKRDLRKLNEALSWRP